MKKLLLFFLLWAYIGMGQVVVPPVCFNYLSNITTGSVGINPYSITNADFNTDGQMDLATANFTSNNVSILMGVGNGVFSPAINFPVGSNPCVVKNADFNNDGKLDLVTANKGSNNISVLFGTTPGSFSAPVNYPVGTTPNAMCVADLNNDASPDVVTTNSVSGNISVLLGSPSGTFSAANNFNVGPSPFAVIAADFNTDGNMDLAVTILNSSTLYILMGNGTGSYPTVSGFAYGFGMFSYSSIVSKDFNGDGKLDIITTNNGSSGGGLSIFIGNGTGGFTYFNSVAIASSARELIANDFNGDSKIDIAVLGYVSDITMLMNNGSASFTLTGFFNSGPLPNSFVSTDFNGDSQLDFAITNTATNKVSIVFGVGDGTLLTSRAYNSGFGDLQGICTGDFNNDGKLDVAIGNDAGGSVTTHLGQGNGLFTSTLTTSYTMSDGAVLSADFNGDGKTDVATCGSTSSTHTVSLMMGMNTGSFSPVNFCGTGIGLDPGDLTCADFNGDGKKDIATSNFSGNTISVFLGTGTGSLSSATNYVAGGSPQAIKNADVNNDGFKDLIVVSGNSANVFIGNGNGTFQPRVSYAVGTTPVGVVTGDWNGDGNADIATVNYGSNNVSILSGSPTGTFSSLGTYSLGLSLASIHVDDFNGDGKLDLVVGSYYSPGRLYFLLGHGTGFFNQAIYFDIGYGATAITSSDFNSDGKPDLALVDAVSTKIFINGAAPSISVSGPTLTCSGSPVNLSASGGGYYLWSNGATASTTTVAPTSTTSFSVTGTNAVGCGVTAVQTISVNPNPTITVNNGAICLGNSFTITPGGATSYTFSGGSAIVSPTATTAYSVSGTSTLGCVGMSLCTVTVNPLPIIAVGDGTVCTGQSFTMTPSGASTYTFSSGSAVVSPTTNTTYSVTGTSAFGCVSPIPAVSNVSISATAAPTISVNSGVICKGNSFTITPSGAVSFTYSSGSSIVSPTTSATYSVMGTDAFGCVSSSPAVSSVTVNTFSISVNSGTLCSGSSFTMVPVGASTYTFSSGSAVVSPTTITASTYSYSVTGTSSYGCASSNTAVATVSVFQTPTVTISNYTICTGQAAYLNPSGAFSYTYSGGTQTPSPMSNTVYTISGSNGYGCIGVATSTVTVLPSVTLTVPNGTICSGESFTIMPSGGTTYTFSSGSAIVTPTNNAIYFITADNGTGCLAYATCSVTVAWTPTVTASSLSPLICAGQTATLFASGANFYNWSSGGTTSLEVVTPTVTTNYTVTGTYLVAGCSSSVVVTQSVSACTGVDNLNSTTQGVTIYPNPFNSKIGILSNEAIQVQIYNAFGSMIYSETIEEGKTEIDLSKKASGVYFVRFGTQVRRIIKE